MEILDDRGRVNRTIERDGIPDILTVFAKGSRPEGLQLPRLRDVLSPELLGLLGQLAVTTEALSNATIGDLYCCGNLFASGGVPGYGEDTLIVTAGRNGWIGDTKYHAVTFSIEGTFTPVGGTPEPFSEFKTWAGGKDANSPDLITCTSAILETDETGTFEGTFTVTAVPAG